MERLSIFDIYKIGVGPSSSHTLGPWKAALDFARLVEDILFDRIEIHLFGSLSKTGVGHGTNIAVQLGLEGYDPKYIDTSKIDTYIESIELEKSISINRRKIHFHPSMDIHFHSFARPEHPNTLTFKAYQEGRNILEITYYSVGGGFIENAEVPESKSNPIILPYPIDKGKELLDYTEETGSSIPEIVIQNELIFRSKEDVHQGIEDIFNTMLDCVFKGCQSSGTLPGGLNVRRRAKKISTSMVCADNYENAQSWIDAIKDSSASFDTINQWISCFALAVNEENASLGRIVTSPTNGAAGVIPAVLLYYYCFGDYKGKEDLRKFFYTSGEIGCLFKKNATISAAVGGCQAEIGVSSAMAAGGLTELRGGSPGHVLMAAEIAMEHHLGLTCDPIGGLVQIPCIERNAMGAMKAITASNLAMSGNPDDAIINFDLVVKAMWDTAQDMNGKYKETAEGGLAINLPVIFPNC